MARPAKWVLNILIPFIALGFGRELVNVISHAPLVGTGRWSSFLIGGAVFVPLWSAARRYVRGPVE